MLTDYPFAEDDRIELLEDWNVRFSNNFVKDRMWAALGCNEDPTYKAAMQRYEVAIAEIQEIHNRGRIIERPTKRWDVETKQWLWTETDREPEIKDARRLKSLQRSLSNEEELRSFANVTLPKGSVIHVFRMVPFDSFSSAWIKLNILETTHPGLQFKKNGGKLSNGKRNVIVRGTDFTTAKFRVCEPNSGDSSIHSA